MARLTLTVFLLALTAGLPAEEEAWTIPAEVCRGYWFVPVTLNEDRYGPGKVLNFLYDTGAASTYVDAGALKKLTDRTFDAGDRVRLVDATSGPVTFNKLPARVANLDHLSMAMGRAVDGILAVDAFRKFLLTIDPQNRSMSLTRGELPQPDGDTVYSVRGPGKRPWLDVMIAGRKERLLVDSGAAGTSISLRRIERFPLEGEPRILSSSMRLKRVEKHPTGRLDGTVVIAGVSFDKPIVDQVPGTQLLGGEILQHFVITLDQRNRRLRLRKIGPDEHPPRPHYALGMAFKAVARGLAVTDVYADAPAEAAGIQSGDVVVAIDGDRPDRRGCEGFDEDGKEVVFSVERAGQVLDKKLTMRPVIP